MSREHIMEDLTAFLSGEMDEDQRRRIREHLETCPTCKEELSSISSLWDALGRLPEEQPRESMRVRFRDMLRSFERTASDASPYETRRRTRWIEGWLAWRPGLVLAFGLAAAACGMIFGYRMKSDHDNGAELAELHQEVRGVSRLLIISLLQQESASERLRGVSWSYRTDAPDAEVTAALLDAFRHDPNVNVRLAALDALSRSLSQPAIREDLLRSLPKQPSPLVQAAIVDAMVQVHEKSSLGIFRQMIQDTALNSSVRKKIELGIQQLI